MEISVHTSDPDAVDPERIARLLDVHGNFYVHSVTVNDGERVWVEGGCVIGKVQEVGWACSTHGKPVRAGATTCSAVQP